MGAFTVIPQDAFEEMQLDAGILLKNFDPTDPEVVDDDIVCATTGGIAITCTPEFTDLAEDVDNAPNGLMEYMKLQSWTCELSTTSLGTSPELIALALGAADVSGDKITPRRNIQLTDFTDLWWVGDRADGGLVACRIINALSTGGFSLQTTKDGKGQIALTISGHVSSEAQNVVPMEFYSVDGDGPVVPDITLNRSNVSLEVDDTYTLRAKTTPEGQTVSWSTSNSTYATVSDGVVTAKATGTATITASMTYNATTYTDTCKITVTA